jgi:hypothetical protein
MVVLLYALQGKSYLCVPFLGIARPQSQFPHSCVWSNLYIFPGSVHIFSCSRIGRPILEIYKSLTGIHMSVGTGRETGRGNWETEHYNSVLEITVSFLGIHKWETDIYIGFSPALHLQCESDKHSE